MRNLRIISLLLMNAYFDDEKSVKNIVEKFGGKEKISTFAIPNEKRGTERLQVWSTSSLKRLITVQEASTEKYNLSRSVNFF